MHIKYVLALVAIVLISGCISPESAADKCISTCSNINGIDASEAEILCKFNTNMDISRIENMTAHCENTMILMNDCISSCSEAGVDNITNFCSLNLANLGGAIEECVEVLNERAILAELEITGAEDRAFAVLDGDTFVLGSGEIIDLIGINAPSKGESGYELSKEKLELYVIGKELTLTEGKYSEDMFGRLPRYVYTTRSFVNYHMVGDGFARAEIVEPDTEYKKLFLDGESYARTNQKGLWVTQSL